jgi:hypothetical protein
MELSPARGADADDPLTFSQLVVPAEWAIIGQPARGASDAPWAVCDVSGRRTGAPRQQAGVAQLAERLICNHALSNPARYLADVLAAVEWRRMAHSGVFGWAFGRQTACRPVTPLCDLHVVAAVGHPQGDAGRAAAASISRRIRAQSGQPKAATRPCSAIHGRGG